MSGDDLSRWLGHAMITAWADSNTHHCQTQDGNSTPDEKHWSILWPHFFCQLPVKFRDVSQGGHWSSLATLLYNTHHLLVQITLCLFVPLNLKDMTALTLLARDYRSVPSGFSLPKWACVHTAFINQRATICVEILTDTALFSTFYLSQILFVYFPGEFVILDLVF